MSTHGDSGHGQGRGRRGLLRATSALLLPMALLAAVLLVAAPASLAQTVGSPIPVGELPELSEPVAVDPVTGVVFVVDLQNGTVEAISEASQSVVADINVGGSGYEPVALAVDPVSGTVYVTEPGGERVVVITEDPSDQADDVVSTVTLPSSGVEGFDGPEGIAVLPGATANSGTVYVTNGAGDFVSVISEADNTVTETLPIPAENGSDDSYPMGIAADPSSGLVYVADYEDGDVSVISGSSLLGSFPLQATNPADIDPTDVATDPDTGTVYVTAPSPSPTNTPAKVYVIQEDPSQPVDATVAAAVQMAPFGDSGALYGVPESIAVNPNTSTVYASNYQGSLAVMPEDIPDPAADAFGEQVALDPADQDFDLVYGLAVDTSTGNPWSGTAYVDSDATDALYPVFFPQPLQSQSISFTAPATGAAGQQATLTATATSGLPVAFSVDASSGAGVCSLSGDTVTYLAAGNCVIDANQAGNSSYAAAAQVTQTITVTGTPPAITSTGSATFTAGTAGSFTVTTTGSPVPALTESGALPAGVSFTDNGNGTATLAGSPAAGAEGTYPVTLSAANSVSTATQPFVLTVNGGLAITSASSATATSGTPFSFTVNTTGTPAATLTHTGTLPPGITFTASTGTATLAGTPTTAAHGVYPVTITAKNAEGTTSQAFALTVNAAPAFSSAASVTETADTAFSYAITATGYPVATLTAGMPLPSGLTFTSTGNGTGTLTSSAGLAAGTYSVPITAANAVGGVSQTVTLTVKAPVGTTEQVPAFTSAATFTAAADAATSFTVTTAGSPTSYASNVTHTGALPAGVTFTNNGNGTATLSGTPTAAAAGSYPMTLTAKDSAGATTQAFTLTVTATAAPSITTAASSTATAGSGFSTWVIATGSPTPAMTESGALPQGLTWTDNGNGTATLAGTPTVGQGGVYPLAFTATNAEGFFAQAFTLTVDQAPSITSASAATATQGTPFSFTITTTGYPAATITRTGTLPSGITFTSNGNGSATLSGTPTKAGTYTLTITAKNAAGTATQTLTITVT
jgi:DNA-binding beta-propeller fold protein YncE